MHQVKLTETELKLLINFLLSSFLNTLSTVFKCRLLFARISRAQMPWVPLSSMILYTTFMGDKKLVIAILLLSFQIRKPFYQSIIIFILKLISTVNANYSPSFWMVAVWSKWSHQNFDKKINIHYLTNRKISIKRSYLFLWLSPLHPV